MEIKAGHILAISLVGTNITKYVCVKRIFNNIVTLLSTDDEFIRGNIKGDIIVTTFGNYKIESVSSHSEDSITCIKQILQDPFKEEVEEKVTVQVGHVIHVEYPDGDRVWYAVIRKKDNKLDLLSEDCCCLSTAYYNKDDQTISSKEGDSKAKILKIYTHNSHAVDKIETKLWERPKEVELTMQEIADKFGISINDLKIKKQ